MNQQRLFSLTISEDALELGERVDKALPALFQVDVPELSRARLQSLIEQGKLSHNGEVITSIKASLKPGEYVLTMPKAEESDVVPEKMDLDIVFEDEDLIIINKPAGLTVHPGAGQAQGTLVNALIHDYGETLSGIGGVKRPGIVHRLDKDTSGLMVVAKNDLAHQRLSAQFEEHTLSRTYTCLVFGTPFPYTGVIETFIGRHPTQRQKMAVLKSGTRGKLAITQYTVIESFQSKTSPKQTISLVECKLKTGRTHQIRVHMNHIGHPIVGDPVYGKKTISGCWKEALSGFDRQALHAKKLELIHPRTLQTIRFHSDMPEDMAMLLERIMMECEE